MSEPKKVEVTLEQFLFIALARAHELLHESEDVNPLHQLRICAAFHTAKELVKQPDGMVEGETYELVLKQEHTESESSVLSAARLN